MPVTQSEIDAIALLGQALYDQSVRQLVEPEHNGKFLVLDTDTGAYEVDADEMKAFERAITRNPQGHRHLVRIGHDSAHRIGARWRV